MLINLFQKTDYKLPEVPLGASILNFYAVKFHSNIPLQKNYRCLHSMFQIVTLCLCFSKGHDDEPLYEISVQEEITARLHFVKFENAYIETCLDFIKAHLVNTETKVIKATGGGAHKFKNLIEKKLGLK